MHRWLSRWETYGNACRINIEFSVRILRVLFPNRVELALEVFEDRVVVIGAVTIGDHELRQSNSRCKLSPEQVALVEE